MLIPRINFTIPTKYNVTEDGRIVGIIKGECFSFFNNKSVEVVDRLRNWELLASAIILSDDELG